jgi:endo-1,4-beta-xylanase
VSCNPNAQWTITAPWTANTYETGTFTTTKDFNRGTNP